MDLKKFKKFNKGIVLSVAVILIVIIYEIVDTKKINTSKEEIIAVLDNYVEEGNEIYEFEEDDIKDNKYTDSGIRKIQERYENLINKYWYGREERHLSDNNSKQMMLNEAQSIKYINNKVEEIQDNNEMGNVLGNMLGIEEVEEEQKEIEKEQEEVKEKQEEVKEKQEEVKEKQEEVKENKNNKKKSEQEEEKKECITSCKATLQKGSAKIKKKAPNMVEVEVNISVKTEGNTERMSIYNGLSYEVNLNSNGVMTFYLLNEDGEWKITSIN